MTEREQTVSAIWRNYRMRGSGRRQPSSNFWEGRPGRRVRKPALLHNVPLTGSAGCGIIAATEVSAKQAGVLQVRKR